ncbi:MAG: type I secretion system permease/ATPase [Gammaproteobacteria bacterium]|nr:type I secretion system permease/ATPase [Gammaproteobacteria bacterium]
MQLKNNDLIRDILLRCCSAFWSVTFFSFLVNLLMLTVPLFTLQLYDRVLVSQSADTLLYLTSIAIFFIAVYAVLEFLRSRILMEVARWLDKQLNPLILTKSADRILLGDRYGYQSQHDMSTIKNFLKSPSFFAFLDMPWFPIFLIAIFFISDVLGVITLFGAILLFFLAYFNQKISAHDLAAASKMTTNNVCDIDAILNHAETVQATGMMTAFIEKWTVKNNKVMEFQSASANHVGLISASSKFLRILIQIILLAVGAYLAMQGKLTGGAMIASSIIAGRALAPVEQFISAWKEFFSAKESLMRLKNFIQLPELRTKHIDLPKAMGNIDCDNLVYMPIGAEQPLLQNIHFKLNAGESVAILGPSGAGKSTLSRLILGVFKATRGAVRLDGADVYHWDRTDFGKQVGYLPQNNGLIDGSIKDNIARLTTDYSDDDVVAAAKMANAHDMILRLPKGYNTMVNEFQLSGGQAKRVALARAFYKNPCLIVLDEPETHLDVDGERALLDAIEKIKAEKSATIIIVTRHLKLIKLMEKTLVLRDGKIQAFGATDEILAKMSGQ